MSRSELFDVNCHIKGETDNAIRIDDGKTTCWLPKSQIEIFKNRDGTATGTVPMWLAKDKELV